MKYYKGINKNKKNPKPQEAPAQNNVSQIVITVFEIKAQRET